MKKKWHKENWFLIGIVMVLVFAVWQPEVGKYIKRTGLLSPLTFMAMFLSGLGVSTANIKEGLRDYKSILYGFAGVFLVFPLVTFLISQLISTPTGDLYQGLMILSVQSSTLSSAIILTMSSGGNVPVALIITILNNTISAVLSPFLLKIYLPFEESVILGDMILHLMIVLVVPVILSQLFRYYFLDLVTVINPYRKNFSKAIVLLFILTAAATASDYLTSNFLIILSVIIFVFFLHLLMVSLAYFYGRLVSLKRESKIAVIFCSAQKTLPATLFIWGNYFSANTLAPLIFVSYHVVQLFVDSVLVNLFNKEKSRAL